MTAGRCFTKMPIPAWVVTQESCILGVPCPTCRQLHSQIVYCLCNLSELPKSCKFHKLPKPCKFHCFLSLRRLPLLSRMGCFNSEEIPTQLPVKRLFGRVPRGCHRPCKSHSGIQHSGLGDGSTRESLGKRFHCDF